MLHLLCNIAHVAEMEHVTPIQCPIEDTSEHGGLIMIFSEFLWRRKVLLGDQVSNSYSLARKVVCKDERASALATFNVNLSDPRLSHVIQRHLAARF